MSTQPGFTFAILLFSSSSGDLLGHSQTRRASPENLRTRRRARRKLAPRCSKAPNTIRVVRSICVARQAFGVDRDCRY